MPQGPLKARESSFKHVLYMVPEDEQVLKRKK